MKTFNDLTFKKHSAYPSFEAQSVLFFDNGYGVSVIKGQSAYSTKDEPYELAVLFGNENEYSISYNTDITYNVIGYLTEDGVSDIMKKVQELK